MSLIRYTTSNRQRSPFDRLSTLQDEVNRLFAFSAPSRDPGHFAGWSPALDLFDEKDQFVLQVELPGLKREEIHLSLRDGVLTVSGERKRETESKENKPFRSERTFGKFQRSVTLPATVESKSVKASYKDGILTVNLPKAEDAKPRQIEVSVD